MNVHGAAMKVIASGLIVVGSGLGGFGICGLVLYHQSFAEGAGAAVCGIALVATGLLLLRFNGSGRGA
jgi:hypothetical protein